MEDSIEQSSHHIYHEGFPIRSDDRISLFHRMMRSRTGLIFFIIFTLVLTVLPGIFFVTFFVVLIVTRVISETRVRKFIVNWCFGAWLHMEAYLVVKLFGIRVRIFGDKEQFSDHSILILNHRCHFDWFFFWIVEAMRGDPEKWMVMMKKPGKYVPLLGWAMQIRNYFFLSRKWEIDETELRWKLNYLKTIKAKYQILMFPEGTDLTPHSKVKSDQYADSNDLPRYEYVLHPKSTGFTYTLKTLREYKIDAIYDITVGYPDVLAKTEPDMFVNNKIPREIHYHITRFDASTIPDTEQEIEAWLRKIWHEKEERLRLFYTHREFRELAGAKGHAGNVLGSPAVLSSKSESDKNLSLFRCLFGIAFLVVNNILYWYICSQHWIVVVGAIVAIPIMMYISIYTDGIDYFIMGRSKDEEFLRKRSKKTEKM